MSKVFDSNLLRRSWLDIGHDGKADIWWWRPGLKDIRAISIIKPFSMNVLEEMDCHIDAMTASNDSKYRYTSYRGRADHKLKEVSFIHSVGASVTKALDVLSMVEAHYPGYTIVKFN